MVQWSNWGEIAFQDDFLRGHQSRRWSSSRIVIWLGLEFDANGESVLLVIWSPMRLSENCNLDALTKKEAAAAAAAAANDSCYLSLHSFLFSPLKTHRRLLPVCSLARRCCCCCLPLSLSSSGLHVMALSLSIGVNLVSLLKLRLFQRFAKEQ